MARLSEAQNAQIEASVAFANGHKVVLLDVGGRKDISTVAHNCNIYCIDDFRNIIWQIQAGGIIGERDSFVSIALIDPGLLKARRFFGNEFTVNADTGVATHVGWQK